MYFVDLVNPSLLKFFYIFEFIQYYEIYNLISILCNRMSLYKTIFFFCKIINKKEVSNLF